MQKKNQKNQWSKELTRIGRLFGGAFLIGIPFVFTVEMWWIGKYVALWKLLIFIVIAFLVGVTLAYFSAPTDQRDLIGSFMQTINSVAVGILSALLVLTVLNEVNLQVPLRSVIGMTAVLTVPLSIGAAASTSVLGANELQNRQGNPKKQQKGSQWRKLANDLGATTAGSIFIGLPIAPTREIPRLAASANYWNLLMIIALSLVITYIIVFTAGFTASNAPYRSSGPFQHPLTETVLAYIISLLMALVTLYLFGRVRFSDPLYDLVQYVLVLGLPTTIGGAAGRLVL